MSEYELSHYQAAVDTHTRNFWAQKRGTVTPMGVRPFQVQVDASGNIAVIAVAGSGKSFLIKHIIRNALPYNVRPLVMAFNKVIADALEPQLPMATVKTYHALGLWGIKSGATGKVQIDGRKPWAILKSFLDRDNWGDYYSAVVKLVGAIKNNLIDDTSDEVLFDLCIEYGLDLLDASDVLFPAVRRLLRESLEMTGTVDFDDMISFHHYHNWVKLPRFDMLSVDEYQDTNKAQESMVEKVLAPGGMVMAVGDPYQGIYKFRGANVNSFPHFIETFHAQTFPLSISYRNPKVIEEYVHTHFPGVQFEAAPGAIEGAINHINLDKFNPQAGDMVLCRINAPLVPMALGLLRKGIKVHVRGADIGKDLVSLVRRMKADDLGDLMDKLAQYRDNEVYKLTRAEREMAAQRVDDNVETILAVADTCKTIEDVTDRITNIFSDETSPVTFSSVHKAKGLEAENVFILKPEMMPSKRAKTQEDKEQEDHIHYVAATRTLNTLSFVHDNGK